MKAIIVGLGSIGRRHLANLRLVEPSAEITVWHQYLKPHGGEEALSSANRVVYELEDALGTSPDIALITSPSPLHVETALALARRDIHLFIEKPLSNSLERVDELIELCHQRSLVLIVGYNFRFYRPLQILRKALLNGQIGRPLMLRAEVGQYLPDWRPGSDYRKNVSAQSGLGGGVALELSHELDYARWLMGEVRSVSAFVGQLSDLDIDVEDTAEIVLQFENGAIGSIHLDMVQRPATRTCRVVGTDGTLVWEWDSHRVRMFSASAKEWVDLHPAMPLDRNETYVAELRHWLDCVRNHAMPSVSAEDGKRVLQMVLAVKQSANEGRVIRL